MNLNRGPAREERLRGRGPPCRAGEIDSAAPIGAEQSRDMLMPPQRWSHRLGQSDRLSRRSKLHRNRFPECWSSSSLRKEGRKESLGSRQLMW